MKPGKEDAFAEKHRAKQKRLKRFAKGRAFIFPGVIAAAFLCGVFGATISWTIVDHPLSIMFGFAVGTWIGIIAANWLVLAEQK